MENCLMISLRTDYLGTFFRNVEVAYDDDLQIIQYFFIDPRPPHTVSEDQVTLDWEAE